MGEPVEPSFTERRLPFVELLRASGLKKRELADRLGIARPSVSRWGAECPQYARAYLELLIDWKAQRGVVIIESDYTYVEKAGKQ